MSSVMLPRELRLFVLSRDSGICHVCLHPGALQCDHVIPVTEDPALAFKASNLRAVHGSGRKNNPCETCTTAAHGLLIYCNAVKQAGSVERARRIIAAKIVAEGGIPDLPGWENGRALPPREPGREW